MDRKDIERTVKNIIASQLGKSEDDIDNNHNFKNDLYTDNTDSLDAVEILILIEDDFDINISDSDYDDLSTVEDLIEYIYEKKNG